MEIKQKKHFAYLNQADFFPFCFCGDSPSNPKGRYIWQHSQHCGCDHKLKARNPIAIITNALHSYLKGRNLDWVDFSLMFKSFIFCRNSHVSSNLCAFCTQLFSGKHQGTRLGFPPALMTLADTLLKMSHS